MKNVVTKNLYVYSFCNECVATIFLQLHPKLSILLTVECHFAKLMKSKWEPELCM